MQQPKFKIGDVVYYPGRLDRVNDSFQVDEIRIHGKEGVHYSGYQDKHIHESHLALFIEPQKKKLCAYKDQFGHIAFNVDDKPFITADAIRHERFEKYDIEYPETKVD